MADVKYLITADSETGAVTKLELVGEDGELTDVDISALCCDSGSVASGATSIVVNIYAGGGGASPSMQISPGQDPKPIIPIPHIPPPHIPHVRIPHPHRGLR
jgi:hypothetical protein